MLHRIMFPSRRLLRLGILFGMLLGSAPTGSASAAETTRASSPEASAQASVDSGAWPLARGNPQATGQATSSLPEKLELLWTFSRDRDGFEAAAVIADGTIFAGSTEGMLYAIDLASGAKKWEYKTESGFSASPAVSNGRVYAGDMEGRFYCLDAATGQRTWHFDTEGEINSSANFHGRHVLFGSQDARLYCLDAETGRLVWKYESADQIRSSPTIAGNQTFVAGCDGRLHIVDLNTGKQTASVDLKGPTGCTPAVLDRAVYVGTEGRDFFAIDWTQAKVLWRYENPQRSAPIRSSAAVTPELVIFGSRDKQVHALDTKTGQARWSFTTRGQVDSSPVIVGSRVFIGSSDGRLYALDLATGRAVWQFEAGGSLLASPAAAGGRLVIGSDEGSLFCFGKKWSVDSGQ